MVLRNPNTISWLKEFVVEGSSAMLWECHASQFAKLFKQTCAELKIPQWTLERSLEHYIQLAIQRKS